MTGHTEDGRKDRELAALVIHEGDEGAFRVLYRRHTPALYQFVLRLLGGDEVVAEDVVQDVWLRAVRALGRFRWESSLRTWLTGIALNLVREVVRRDGRLLQPAEGFELPVRPESTGERIDLERAIRLLPPGFRAVLVLHDVEGFTHREIARRLQISVGTSRSQLHHARRAMRRLLNPPEPETALELEGSVE
jgi:RNA polymerase sigma-70 factor (ECF subfamily)